MKAIYGTEFSGVALKIANRLSIQLDEKDGTYFVSLVCREEDGTGTEAKVYFTKLAEYFSEIVFEGKPVKINVCSRPFRPYATYP